MNPLLDWHAYAECRELQDPEVMFPVVEDGSTPLSVHEVAVAKSVCARCPVQAACRDWAIDTGQDHGLWGGLTSPERRVLARERVA